MRLVQDYPISRIIYIEDGEKRITLAEFCQQEREKAGLSRGRLGSITGLNHPTVHNYETGVSSSLTPMLIALDALGYEVEIKPKKVTV